MTCQTCNGRSTIIDLTIGVPVELQEAYHRPCPACTNQPSRFGWVMWALMAFIAICTVSGIVLACQAHSREVDAQLAAMEQIGRVR